MSKRCQIPANSSKAAEATMLSTCSTVIERMQSARHCSLKPGSGLAAWPFISSRNSEPPTLVTARSGMHSFGKCARLRNSQRADCFPARKPAYPRLSCSSQLAKRGCLVNLPSKAANSCRKDGRERVLSISGSLIFQIADGRKPCTLSS